MDIKKFKALLTKAKRKDVKDNEKATAKAEELRFLLQNACSQLVAIYEYVEHDFRFKYDDVHYTVTLDRIDPESEPDKIHIDRCINGKLNDRDIDMVAPGGATSKDLELMNEVITNWFKSKGVY